MSAPDAFWIVWAPAGRLPPRVRHSRRCLAEAEAHRLARENPGAEFIVMQATVRMMQPASMVVEHYHCDDDQVPF